MATDITVSLKATRTFFRPRSLSRSRPASAIALFVFSILWIALWVPISNAEPSTLFPSQVTVEQNTLTLQGTGVRTATFFAIKVYTAALYLSTPSASSTEILSSNAAKRIDLYFHRSVGAGKLQTAWREGYAANTSNSASFAASIEQLCNAMSDMNEGDTMSFAVVPPIVRVSVNGKEKASINDAVFAKAFLSVWLGPKPPNPELKQGLLGLAK